MAPRALEDPLGGFLPVGDADAGGCPTRTIWQGGVGRVGVGSIQRGKSTQAALSFTGAESSLGTEPLGSAGGGTAQGGRGRVDRRQYGNKFGGCGWEL